MQLCLFSRDASAGRSPASDEHGMESEQERKYALAVEEEPESVLPFDASSVREDERLEAQGDLEMKHRQIAQVRLCCNSAGEACIADLFNRSLGNSNSQLSQLHASCMYFTIYAS